MDTLFAKLSLSSEHSGSFNGTWLGHGASDDTGLHHTAEAISSICPTDGHLLGKVFTTSAEEYEKIVADSVVLFDRWKQYPAPKRGELIRQIGNELRLHKEELAQLISVECGKILTESLGEVQEAIDIADFAVGLSRQLYGLSMHSERPQHRMYEQWHPLGPVAVITAFNFPLAVWAWNAFIAAVCGDVIVWKPSEETPLIAIAATKLSDKVLAAADFSGVFSLVNGTGKNVGQAMAADARFPLVSATGSTAMGRAVGETVAKRLGRSLLELGGNNAVIVLKDADLDLAVDSIAFGAAGTAGQRCTTTRRVIAEQSVITELSERLLAKYKQFVIGDPLHETTVIGPLINQRAVDTFSAAIEEIRKQGGTILYGGTVVGGLHVTPTIVLAKADMPLLREETFAPIVYLIPAKDLADAIVINNSVPQGLSSAIFTDSVRASESFLSSVGSDCGIANVNIGTSGAEIGGAFGGEKETGGGRESGSDSWRAYMRRQTNTINWGKKAVLAQGVVFP